MTWKDYRVKCNDCGSEYTPKSKGIPKRCYNYKSQNIDFEPVNMCSGDSE